MREDNYFSVFFVAVKPEDAKPLEDDEEEEKTEVVKEVIHVISYSKKNK